MPNYIGLSNYEHGSQKKRGVLLVNLGTPDAPTPKAVRKYLKEFLWDPRVIEMSRPLWWLLLNAVILNIRPRRSAKAYQKIWGENSSPLLDYSERLTNQVRERVNRHSNPEIVVELAMRYGRPSIDNTVIEMHKQGVCDLLVMPLYPQYSATTTGSVLDAVSAVLSKLRWVPNLVFVNGYYENPDYIDALRDKVRDHWRGAGAGEKLIVSFHGLPKRYLDAGDPYHCFCHATARLLSESLALKEEDWVLTFQSRFGREPWLQPYTDIKLKQLAKDGVKSVDVFCPGFAVDCLETLEEIAIQNKELFLQAGGEKLTYIPCLNDDEAHVRFLTDLIRRHLHNFAN